ncbi:MAG: inosine/xanthosine triphosphatase [Euryarchaeota archaeon]|nr:inosine/xanthosine triphosphatase [Euryarchaeota archaeon]
MKAVGVGGTFNVLHKGHRTLLDKAFEIGAEVRIGITSDEYVRERKSVATPFDDRRDAVRSYAETKGKPYTLLEIDDPFSIAVDMGDLEALVVSPESRTNAEEINKMRRERGHAPLKLVKVPYAMAEDFCPISSSRVLSGKIDVEGHLLRPLRVCVGSTNPVKVAAVRSVFERLFKDVVIGSVEVDSGVGKQPFQGDVLRGARRRAMKSLDGYDLGIGIEAGVYKGDDGLYDVQQCAIIDGMGRVTHGHGPGFKYPPEIESKVRSGMSVGEAVDEIFKTEKNGRKGGAIGLLTNGLLKRKELTEQSVIAAMVPRIRPELYEEE